MKRLLLFACLAALVAAGECRAGFLDELTRQAAPLLQGSALDDATVVKGLKEALATGTERAVNAVAKPDGYFGNQLVKILLPEKIRTAADVLGTLGYRKQVDEFILSMNRAAEKAAPKAAGLFGDAVRQMTFDDAKKILNGGDRAATTFLEGKTRSKLFEEFKPVIAKSMSEVGTTRAYQEMIGKYEALPLAALAGGTSLDLDTYVTDKALDGLFTMLGEEEKKIRTNPAARTTELLKTVFGSK
ncbi:DUF4197 domain-containing protein [Geobacter sulfurreducens]|uniref:DUF4197 domain-containing protein n=1 Tax=Geobacter sulfurreducens TaxID=35554 RepID=UPI000DBAE940|nr:DUF4197 domain-containing protein [Geobacter sulfurreducens]BBA69733.1 hypothetical protein YM18_1191 [Geobacter sulfurreducens]